MSDTEFESYLKSRSHSEKLVGCSLFRLVLSYLIYATRTRTGVHSEGEATRMSLVLPPLLILVGCLLPPQIAT